MRCPYCSAANREGMKFCIDCGEPLDGSAPAGAVSESDRGVASVPSGRRRPRSWELALGAVMLVLVLGVSSYYGWQDIAQNQLGRAYRQGQAFEERGMVAEALEAYGRAGDYQGAKTGIERLTPVVAELKRSYQAGLDAAAAGRWWDAGHQLRLAADIEVSYSDIITRLAEAKLQTSPILYRQSGPVGGSGIWYAALDGSGPQYIPYSDENTKVHAISSDGAWAIYSLLQRSSEGNDRSAFLLDLKSGANIRLSGRFGSVGSNVAAYFRPGGEGFYVSFDNRFVYYRLPVAGATPSSSNEVLSNTGSLTDIPAGFDPVSGQMLLNRFHYNRAEDTYSGRLLLLDPDSRQISRTLSDEPGVIHNPYFDDSGRYLLYSLTISTADSGAGIITTTVIVRDLQADKRYEIGSQVVHAGESTGWIDARFIPGKEPGVLVSRSDDGVRQVALLSPDGSTSRVLDRPWGGWTNGLRISPDGGLVAGSSIDKHGNPGAYVIQVGGSWGAWLPMERGDIAQERIIFTHGEQYALYVQPEGESQVLHSIPVQKDSNLLTDPTNLNELFALNEPLENHIAPTRDGSRVLVAHGSPANVAGIYVMNPDGSDRMLLVKGATELWTAQNTNKPITNQQDPMWIGEP